MKMTWIKTLLSASAKVLPCTVLLSAASVALDARADVTVPDPVYTWDGTGGTATSEKVYGKTVYTVSGKVINADNDISGGVPAKNFTFSMWTKKSTNPNWRDVCGFADSSHQFKLEENTNGGLYVYGTNQGLYTNADPRFIPADDFSASNLQLLTVVQENGTVKGYINGELKMTTLESTVWASLKSDTAKMTYFAWGCSPSTSGGADRSFSISAADVRIYNEALSAEQVKAAYDAYENALARKTVTLTGDSLLSSLNITSSVTTIVEMVANADVTITMDLPLSAYQVVLSGTGKITFIGANKLEGALSVNTDVDITAIPARLDTIEVAAGKTLSVDLNTRWTSASGEGTIAEPERDSISFRVDSAYGDDTFSTGTRYGWLSARVDGSAWNALADSVTSPVNKDRIQLTTTAVTVNGKGGGWSHTAPKQLGGVNRGYFDGQWNLSLSGVPYSKYAVVLYMATDNGGKVWGPVKVTSGSMETFYSYDENRELIFGDGVTESSTWGTTATANGNEGVDVMVIPNLSGDVTLLTHGTSGTGDAVRGGLFAMQIINTGTSEIESKTFTASSDATEVSLSNLTWNEAPLEPTAFDSATVTLVDGATFTIDGTLSLAKLKLVCEGSVTIVATTEAIANIATIDATAVTGVTTYNAADWYSRIPFAKFVGVDKIRKTCEEDWNPGDVTALNGYQLEIAKGLMLVNATMTSVVATAEKPILVTGEGSVLKFNANQNADRMPHNGYIKATNGGVIELTGVNPFNGDNGPHVVLDNGILRTTATGGGHIKVQSVTLANGSKLQLSRAATAYASEGLVIQTGDASKIIVTTGNNTIEYREDGSATNTLFIQSGVIDVASGATLDVKVTVTTPDGTSITKTGEGQLLWNGGTSKPIAISAGEVVFNADSAPTNAFSGMGSLVVDGATLDLTHTTVTDCALAMRNNGVLVLTKDQVGTMTVPAGCTLKVKVDGYGATELTTVTLADDTASVYFVLPNGNEVKGTVDGTKITMPEQTVYTYTATAGAENLWSTAENWKLNGATIESAPTGTITTPVEVKLTGATTLTVDADVVIPALSISGGELTIAGTNTLTTETLASSNKIFIGGKLVVTGGTEATPFEFDKQIEISNGGTLTTKGYLNCSAANKIASGATLDVVEGVTTFNLEGTGLSGTVKVASGATLKNGTSDGPNYNGSPTLDIAGTLEVTGTARWSLPTGTTTTLREGALLKGAGGTGYNYAYDWFSGDTITVEGNATIEGNIGSHNGGKLTLDVAEGKILTLSGKYDGGVYSGSSSLEVVGAGTVKLTGTNNTYSGGTTIDAGATIEATTIANFPATGSVVVNGRLRLVPGRDLNEETSTAYGTAEAPRLVGSGILEFAGNNGYYVIPAGFTTPLAVENNRTNGIVVSAAPGITIGTLSGTGYFRADLGDNAGASRVITVKQSKASTFSGYVTTNNATTRAVTLRVMKADGVAEDVDTTLTIEGNTTASGTTLSIDSGSVVKLKGTWTQAIVGEGTAKILTQTINGWNLANLSDPNTTIEILEGETLTCYFANGTAADAKFDVNGTLHNTNGSSNNGYTIRGAVTGNGLVKLSGNPTDAVRFSGDIAGFMGDMTIEGANRAITFCAADTAVNQKNPGKILVHADYAYPAKVNGTWTASEVIVSANKTLAGAGKINGTLVLNDGVTLDVTTGVLSVETLGALPNALTVVSESIPTLATDRLTLFKVKTLPADLHSVAITLNVTGEDAVGEFELMTGDIDADGYTPLQLKAKIAATVYTVNTADYPSLSAALIAGDEGPFGANPTSPMSMIIDFGDAPVDGEPTPGEFVFDFPVEFVKVLVRGTNGGVVTKADVVPDGTSIPSGTPVVVTLTDLEVAAGVNCTMNCTMDAVLVADAARVALNEGVLCTLSYKDTADLSIGAIISGAGQLGFQGTASAGAMKLLSANTYTGGTVIAANTTVEALINGIGSGALTGAGKLVMPDYPESADVRTSMGDADKWTGHFVNTGNLSMGDNANWFGAVGNENSVVEFTGTSTGYLKQAGVSTADLIVTGSITFNNGWSTSGGYTFNGDLLGTGTLATTNTPTDVLKFLGETKDFAGTITVAGGHCIAFGEQADTGTAHEGKLIVAADHTANVAADKTWTAVNGIEVAGTIGGEGTINSKFILADGATLMASKDACLKLAAGAALKLPAAFMIAIPEGETLSAGVPVVVLDRADTDILSLEGVTATVKVGEETVDAAVLALSETGDLIVQIPGVFEAVVPAGETAWEGLQWMIAGAPAANSPGIVDDVLLKPETVGAIVTYSKAPLRAASLSATGDVTLRFSRECITQDMYEAIPTTVKLVETITDLDEKIVVQLAPLKYGALATVTQNDTSASASLTLPDSALIDTGRISINFKANSNYQVSGTEPVGLAGYEVLPEYWSQFAGNNSQDQDVTMVTLPTSKATETLTGVLDFSAGGVYNTGRDDSHAILRGYLDDNGNGINISIDVPDTWTSYKAIIYCATDTANTTFAPRQINGTWYTYANGELVASTNRPGAWGDSNARTELIEGVNTMVVTGLSGDFALVSTRSPSNGPRACVAGIQLIEVKSPAYNLISSVTATVSAADADEAVAWNELEWKDEDGDPAAQPDKTQPVVLVIESDVTLDLSGATAMQIQVLGYGHHIRIIGTVPNSVPFIFSEDTIYRLVETADALPANVLRMPGELRYEYAYDASRSAYVTIPGTTSNFVAGFSGEFTAAGGGIKFSTGDVALSAVTGGTIEGSSVQTQITFSGDSRATATDTLRIGNADVLITDNASVTLTKLALADNSDGLTTNFVIEESARLTVTGNVNNHHESNGSQSSLVFAHWQGVANVTVRDNAALIAEKADAVMTVSGISTLTIEDNAEVRVKGLVVHKGRATCEATVNLKGGKLLIGETGIRDYATTDVNYDFAAGDSMVFNFEGGVLGAMSGTVTLGADTATAVREVTGEPIFESVTGTSLKLMQAEPFLTAGTATNRGGDLCLNALEVNTIDVQGGSVTIVGDVACEVVKVATNATLALDGGVLTTEACAFADSARLQIPVRDRLADCGYVVMSGANAELPDLSTLVLALELDADRTDAEKVLPEQPLVLGAFDENATPNLKGVSLSNNTNNAITDYEVKFVAGDMGEGLYLSLTGNEVLASYEIILTKDKEHTLSQEVADGYPYHHFWAKEPDASVNVPAEGVAVSHTTFTGEQIRVVAQGNQPALLLQTNNTSIATNIVFDLSKWAAAMPDFVAGAVRGVPMSQCLISGGISIVEGYNPTAYFGDGVTFDGVSIEVGADGLYLVARAETRVTRSVSVNFTNVSTPLIAPPAQTGVYAVDVAAWNDFNRVYSSSELKQADMGGVASSIATAATDKSVNTRLQVYTSSVNMLAEAPTSMLKVWLDDANGQLIRIQNAPFATYRVAVIFANDLEGAAYAPVQMGETYYAMDAAGWMRRDIVPYEIRHARTGLLSLAIAGDELWGSTNLPEAAAPVVMGHNALVSDVLTASELEIQLPGVWYGRRYAGIAALQIIEVPQPDTSTDKTFTYTVNTDANLEDLTTDDTTETWTSGAQHKLVLNVANNDVVTVTLPVDFTADSIMVAGEGKVTLKVQNNGGIVLNALAAEGLTGDLTVDFPCAGVAFTAPTGVTTFNASFNNNAQPYTIVAGATLVLGETSGITTDMNEGVASPMLRVNPSSEGTLRRNYSLTEAGHAQGAYAKMTLAYKQVTRNNQTNANADNSAASILVEEGDVFRHSNDYHMSSTLDWNYTQTGGEAFFEGAGNPGGILLFNNDSASNKTATINVSGGRLFTTMIWAWKEGTQATINVSETGVWALGSSGLRTYGADRSITASIVDGGTLELANSELNRHGNGTITVTVEDGVITTTQTTASLNIPVEFAAEETAPTKLAPALASTLVLNATNTGTGFIEVTQGKVAVTATASLAETTVTVKSGATLELRDATADAEKANTLKLEAGATLAVTAADTVTTVRVAGADKLDIADGVIFRLNGEIYSDVTVDVDAGTVTFETKAVAEDVTWDVAQSSGTWADGVAGPWVNTNGTSAVYYNGATVTFPKATGKVDVKVLGDVRPAAITWAAGTASDNIYRFTAADVTSYLTLSGATLDLGGQQVYDVPVATAMNVEIEGANNTYRLVGSLSDDRKTASLSLTGAQQWTNTDAGLQNCGVWCTDGVVLAPRAGETQIVSAMGYPEISGKRSHLSGAGDVTITGGGKVQFAGAIMEGGAEGLAFQNKNFSGKILVKDNSTLDITMVRTYNASRPWDDYVFFALPVESDTATKLNNAGAARWADEVNAGVSVQNGATFRVSGCRSIFGGYRDRENEALLKSFPLEIGYGATAEFAFGERHQMFPHGFRLNGDGAKLLATQNMYLSGGTTIKVAGIGDAADPTDPKAGKDADNAETYQKLTAGISAEVASSDVNGLVPWNTSSASKPLTLDVGEGSTLIVSANLLTPTGDGDALSSFKFEKVGLGALRFTRPIVDGQVDLTMTEGVLGGTTTFTHGATKVAVKAGTVVEAGLSLASLTAESGAIFAIHPQGKQVLSVESLNLAANGTYTLKALNETAVPQAETLAPIKVMGWSAAPSVETVRFVLDDALATKGYAIEVRQDGLYLMKEVVYVRDLSNDVTTAGKYRLEWYAENAWYRLDDPQTMRDYDPLEGEAVTVQFVLPSDPFAAENASYPEKITFVLYKAVSFANIRFVTAVETTDESGAVTTEYKTVPVPVTYEYSLLKETMPEAGDAKRFTWVPTLVLAREDGVGLAQIEVVTPIGYEYSVNNTTVMVYISATQPALNINFTESVTGGTGISDMAAPCGVVPFAGVYWNNATTTPTADCVREHVDANHSIWNLEALPAGMTVEDGEQLPRYTVTYAVSEAKVVASRLSGSANDVLMGSFFAGKRGAALSETLRGVAGLTDAGVEGGWQVRVSAVPFARYDLYIVFAGEVDGAVTYPAVRVKVGNATWRTFSVINGWTAPAAKESTWVGEGALTSVGFVDGSQVLHLRLEAPAGSPLEIAPWDNGLSAEAAAKVGLAAIQIVSCDTGVVMERMKSGKWSDAEGWNRTLADGSSRADAWMDSTAEAPRYATISSLTQLEADIPVAVPYVKFTGKSTMTLTGKEGVISTGAVDLSEMEAGSTVTFSEDFFAEPVNVFLAPNITVSIPENAFGTVENDWNWLQDDATRTSSTSATIQKQLAGDVIFRKAVPYNLDVDAGTLWMDLAANATIASTISGEAGTFAKKGTGTLTHSGTISIGGQNPLRVSEGRLSLSNALTAIDGDATVLVDGGTLEMASGAGFTTGSTVAVDHGTLIVKGTQRWNRPHLRLSNGSRLDKPNGDGGWQGYQFESVIAEGLNNTIGLNSAGSGGPCVDIINGFTLLPGATLTIQGGGGALRVCNGIVDVREGAVLTSQWRVGRGNADGYGAETDVLTKTGTGLWRIERVLSAKGDSKWGQTFVVAEGEACFAFGGANYDVERTTPITVQAGAKLSGNVAFTDKTDVTFEEGAIVRSGVVGVQRSKLTFNKVEFGKDTIFEVDLSNTEALKVNTEALFNGAVTIRLLNMNAFKGEDKCLMTLPKATTINANNFTSPEAVALDAKFEVIEEEGSKSLWLKSANTSYTWTDASDVWSKEEGWMYQGAAITYPEGEAVAARVVANEADVTLTLDDGADTQDYGVWEALSLVATSASGKTVAFEQGATLDETQTPAVYNELYSLLVSRDIWKLGAGKFEVKVPVKYSGIGATGSLSIDEGEMVVRHPLTLDLPSNNASAEILPVPLNVAKDATLTYALETIPVADGVIPVINNVVKYQQLKQSFTDVISGAGTVCVAGENNEITLAATTDHNLNYDVQKGTLIVAGGVETSSHSTLRTIKVASGAKLALNSAYALGGSSNIEWTLNPGAMVATANDARVRGQVTTFAGGAAVFGSLQAELDNVLQVSVPESATLEMGGTWTASEDAAEGTALIKSGKGTLVFNDFAANVPVTISAGTLSLPNGGISLINENNSATSPVWTIASGATLQLNGGSLKLAQQKDNVEVGHLTIASGATLDVGKTVTTLVVPTTFADSATLVFGSENGRVIVNTDVDVNVQGIVTINVDALNPEMNNTAEIELLNFTDANRLGGGVFQLGGNIVAWAENGWTLHDSGKTVKLLRFGNTSYYTWAGDGSEGSTGDGNWANTFWLPSGKTSINDLVAWPTTEENPSVKLQDTNPVDGSDIPEEAMTLDWTLADQTLGSFYVMNDVANYTVKASSGDATFSLNGDFLKTGKGSLAVNRPVEFVGNGALRVLGGMVEFTGDMRAFSGDFTLPVTVAGDAVLRFKSSSNYYLGGLLEGNGTGTITQAGTGNVTIADTVNQIKALSVEAGNLNLTADDQYEIKPEITVAEKASLTIGGVRTGAGEVKMQVNAGATDAAGVLVWNAQAASSSDLAPRLAAIDGVNQPAIVVDTFRYQPQGGHLVIDPNANILKPGFKLEMMSSNNDPTAALWLGKTLEDGRIEVSALTGEGVIGVEPIIIPSTDKWASNRTITVAARGTKIAEVEAFNGNFMGAKTPTMGEIRIGVTIEDGAQSVEGPAYFRYAGESTHETLGTFTISENAVAEITGTWTGDVDVLEKGLLMGNGTIGAMGRTTRVPKGAAIAATAYGQRITDNNIVKNEVIPTTLKIDGTLALEAGSILNTMIRKDQYGDTVASLVSTSTLELPAVLEDNAKDVMLTVNLDIEEGATLSGGVKILGWTNLNGGQKINGTVMVNGEESAEYELRKQADGLYLYRKSARFLLILQ